MTYLVTGGAGFIGSAYLNLFVPRLPDVRWVNLDALTYAGNLESLAAIERSPNYRFVHLDLRDREGVDRLLAEEQPDVIVHFAAESHVDRSIHGPRDFIETNVIGTLNLLEACRSIWKSLDGKRFHHVSTDEVYGSLDETGYFTESTPYDPSSPYSASKAASDHLVRAYHRTYGLPMTITNCSNNYGPRQFPEKLIPLMILHALEGQSLPIYGKGQNVRDWLFVDDHCEAIQRVIEQGCIGETYNVGGNSERSNREVVARILDVVSEEAGIDRDTLEGRITYVQDRPGHDFRYAIDASKINRDLGWTPRFRFEEGLRDTVRWYLSHMDWVERVRSGEYRTWLERNYGGRA